MSKVKETLYECQDCSKKFIEEEGTFPRYSDNGKPLPTSAEWGDGPDDWPKSFVCYPCMDKREDYENEQKKADGTPAEG